MSQTYDEYLTQQKYAVYFAFGESFSSKEQAERFVKSELSRLGALVEVMCMAVPDAACQNCGEELFDWQSSVGECVGTAGSDTCYFSTASGLICEHCAELEIKCEVHEEDFDGSILCTDDELTHLL